MIILEPNNLLVESCLNSKYNSLIDEPKKIPYFEESFSDFDKTTYRINLKEKDSSVIQINLKLACIKELEKNNLKDYLSSIYAGMLLDKPVSGYSVTLEVDLANLSEDIESLIKKVSLLKRHCYAAAFVNFFKLQKNGTETDVMKIPYRENESLYLRALKDRVTVTYSTQFRDVDDLTISRVFMQEFTEARRRYDYAPQIIYNAKTPPSEISKIAESADNIAYITFILDPRNYTDAKREKTIDLIFMLRNYIHYHIKCSKAYLQMRMRAKATEFVKVLNRSKTIEGSKQPYVKVNTNLLYEL